VTDARSNKVDEIAAAPAGEFAWYFPESRDQFRIAGRLTVVAADTEDQAMQKARGAAWNRMSPNGRASLTPFSVFQLALYPFVPDFLNPDTTHDDMSHPA